MAPEALINISHIISTLCYMCNGIGAAERELPLLGTFLVIHLTVTFFR